MSPPISPIWGPGFDGVETLIRSTCGQFFYDLRNDEVTLDEQARELLALERAPRSRAQWSRRIPAEDLPGVEAAVAGAIPEASTLELRHRFRRGDGELRWLWILASIARDAAGEAYAITGLLFDETELRRAESSARLHAEILDSIGEGVYLSRARDDRILYANAGLGRMLRREPCELVGASAEALGEGERGHIRAVVEASGSWLGEVERRRADGSRFWSSTSVTAIDHPELGPLWVTVIHELDEPRRREGELPRDRRQLATIYDAIADAVFCVDMPRREISSANRAVTEMFGYELDEVLGRSTAMLYPERGDYERFGARLRQAFLAGQSQVHAELELVTKDGRKVWTSVLTTFVTEEGELVQAVSVIRDVSVRKQLEAELLHTQKMEALGTLAGGLAHDMNNVLAAILTLAEVMRDELQEGEAHGEDLVQIHAAATRGKSLVENLLGFARKTSVQHRAVDLDDEVRKVIDLLRRSLAKALTIDTDLNMAGASVTGDSGQLSQTVLNLCLNARDAVGARGRICVSSERVEIGEGDGDEFHGLAPGAYYRLRIRDDGPGMSPEVQARAFDPFFTTKPVGEGTGLGLSMAYGVLHQNGGSITIDSEPGRGTTVSCLLPLSAGPQAERRASPARAVASLRVLVVDDEALVRRTSKRALERLGHEVRLAESCEAALSCFTDAHEELDLVLLDLCMPGMTGNACLERMRSIDEDTPVVVATGFGDAELEGELREKGATAVLGKPYGLDELRELLAEVAG